MNIRKLRRRLIRWGDFNIRHMDHADEYGENILYAAGILEGRVQDASRSCSKILCPDAPRHVQEVDIAVNKLPFAQKRAITNWYCAPLREDGNPHTKAQIAMKSRTSRAAFELALSDGEKKLLYLLTDC